MRRGGGGFGKTDCDRDDQHGRGGGATDGWQGASIAGSFEIPSLPGYYRIGPIDRNRCHPHLNVILTTSDHQT